MHDRLRVCQHNQIAARQEILIEKIERVSAEVLRLGYDNRFQTNWQRVHIARQPAHLILIFYRALDRRSLTTGNRAVERGNI